MFFIGLGCDVAAIYSFLKTKKINIENFFTVELICHGPTYDKVAKQYIDALEERYGSQIKEFSVRYKKTGWVPNYIFAKFHNGREYSVPFYETDYGYAFNLYGKPYCYHCNFRGKNHQADMIVGDYWGLSRGMDGYNPDGVSLFLVRTERGEKLLQKIDTADFYLQPADIELALSHNSMYYMCRTKPRNWECFDKDLSEYGLHRAVVKSCGGQLRYFLKRSPVVFFVKRFLRKFLKKAVSFSCGIEKKLCH